MSTPQFKSKPEELWASWNDDNRISWRGEIRTAISGQWRLSPDKWNVDYRILSAINGNNLTCIKSVTAAVRKKKETQWVQLHAPTVIRPALSVLLGNLEFKRPLRQPCLEGEDMQNGSCQSTFQEKGDAEQSKTRLWANYEKKIQIGKAFGAFPRN